MANPIEGIRKNIDLALEKINSLERELLLAIAPQAKFSLKEQIKEAKEGLENLKADLKQLEKEAALKKPGPPLPPFNTKINQSLRRLKAATVKIFDPQNKNIFLGTGFFFDVKTFICNYHTTENINQNFVLAEFQGKEYQAFKLWENIDFEISIYSIMKKDFSTIYFLENELNPQLPLYSHQDKTLNVEDYFCSYGFSDPTSNGTLFMYYYAKSESLNNGIEVWRFYPYLNKDIDKALAYSSAVMSLKTGKVYGILKKEQPKDNSILVIPLKSVPYNLMRSGPMPIGTESSFCEEILYECLIRNPTNENLNIVLNGIKSLKNDRDKIYLPFNSITTISEYRKEDFISALARVLKGINEFDSFIKTHNSLLSKLTDVVSGFCEDAKSRFLLFYLCLIFIWKERKEIIDDDSIISFHRAFRKRKKENVEFMTFIDDPSLIVEKILESRELDSALLWLVKERSNIAFDDFYFHKKNQSKERKCHDLLLWGKDGWNVYKGLTDLSGLCSEIKELGETAIEGEGFVLTSPKLATKLEDFRLKEAEINEEVTTRLNFNDLLAQFEKNRLSSSDFSWSRQGSLFIQAITLLYQHSPNLAYRTAFS